MFIVFKFTRPQISTLLPYTTLFRSKKEDGVHFLPLDQESLQNHDLRDLFANYLPAEITHQNYPNLIAEGTDRKSTRLNSSHMSISYAVFCLKKKKIF